MPGQVRHPLDGEPGPSDIAVSEFAREHFRTEETYLEKYEYAERASHHDEHEKFMRDIGALSARSDEGERVSPEQVFNYLSSWIGHHLRVVDARYIPLLQARMRSGNE